jgi:hypothetical protein
MQVRIVEAYLSKRTNLLLFPSVCWLIRVWRTRCALRKLSPSDLVSSLILQMTQDQVCNGARRLTVWKMTNLRDDNPFVISREILL